MATLLPFRALRPQPADAARVAAVPYDVVSTEEARQLAGKLRGQEAHWHACQNHEARIQRYSSKRD